MNIPEQIDIDGVIWKVKFDNTLQHKSTHGECDVSKLEIRICPNISQQQQEITFMHECLHAIWEMAGFQPDEKIEEEEICFRFARPILYLFTKNDLL